MMEYIKSYVISKWGNSLSNFVLKVVKRFLDLICTEEVVITYKKHIGRSINKMEGFEVLQINELYDLSGGGALMTALGYTVACTAIGFAPAVAILCPPAGAGMLLGGLGILGKVSGSY